MSFLSFVKTAFTDVGKVAKLVNQAQPILIPAITAASPEFGSAAALTSTITGFVVQAEELFQNKQQAGAEKKATVMNLVDASMPLVVASMGDAGRSVDAAKIQDVVSKFIDAIVAALNAAAAIAAVTHPNVTPAKA